MGAADPLTSGGRARRSVWRDLSVSAVVAGFVAVLVGFSSSVAIVFAAAQALGANAAQTTSWIWALGLANATVRRSRRKVEKITLLPPSTDRTHSALRP